MEVVVLEAALPIVHPRFSTKNTFDKSVGGSRPRARLH